MGPNDGSESAQYFSVLPPGAAGHDWAAMGANYQYCIAAGDQGCPQLSHYAAAKAGVIGFSKSLALEMAEHNVLVNVIAPGPIETPMIADFDVGWKTAKSAELPLGRFGRAEEVAPTAVFLASEPGGNLYVGQTLGPNSGDVMP